LKAFLYHFHGIGDYDFSELRPEDLEAVQALAAERDYEILPTVYLRRPALSQLIQTMRAYRELREAGALPNIAGFAIEGPLLGPQGGIPRAGRWYPTVEEWRSIAGLGPLGLQYIVMAPDAMALDERIDDGPSFSDLLLSLYDNGVRIAQGHFHRNAPERSARRMTEVLEFLHHRYDSSPFLVLTDHLYNDMPRNFAHAFRTPEEREAREDRLRPVLEADWESADLAELLGPVPATMIRAARDGLLMPCLNFDGYHVDPEVCGRTLRHLGPRRLIALTDHTEVTSMAQERLSRSVHSGLLLRDDGAVAAGSLGYEQQRANILGLGFDEATVRALFVTNPKAAVDYEVSSVRV
jgi:N-acetylglucosamine-6-phosphate deacetylase